MRTADTEFVKSTDTFSKKIMPSTTPLVYNDAHAGYSGDVWDQQPPPKDHPWLDMPNHAMTPHISGTTLEAQQRYLQGTHDMLNAWFDGKAFEESYYIVREGDIASQYQ